MPGKGGVTHHDRQWAAHPAVPTGDDLTFGQRAADRMRSGLGTWTFLIALAGVMALWIATGGFGHDPMPFILLNLCLSTLAGIQAAVLLIAAKRSDEIAAATALHTLENTEQLADLLRQNTTLTQQTADAHTQQAETLSRVETMLAEMRREMRERSTASVRDPKTGRYRSRSRVSV